MENINDIDETKLLGYFESIKSVFLLKLIFIVSHLKKEEDGKLFIDASRLTDAINSVMPLFSDDSFYKALSKGNEELYLNYHEDMLTSLITSSWNVFEQITKDLVKPDYATQTDEQSVAYQNKKFQFDAREKKDIELFYYFRNAIHHYNGAYYAAKDINHRYRGIDFISRGHHGEKIDINTELAWKIACDLEQYTMKAWQNVKNFKPTKPLAVIQ